MFVRLLVVPLLWVVPLLVVVLSPSWMAPPVRPTVTEVRPPEVVELEAWEEWRVEVVGLVAAAEADVLGLVLSESPTVFCEELVSVWGAEYEGAMAVNEGVDLFEAFRVGVEFGGRVAGFDDAGWVAGLGSVRVRCGGGRVREAVWVAEGFVVSGVGG